MNLLGEDETTSFLSPVNLLGGFLVVLGAGVLLWVVSSLFHLFSDASSFLVLNEIVPKEMIISQSANGAKFLFPRELLIFGIPIWALTAATRIGLTLLKSGLDYFEKPRRKA
jgi:hypothetical protein